MKLNKFKTHFVILICSILFSCGGDSPSEPTTPKEPIASPEAVTLVFPENNKECNTGEIFSDSKSNVIFTWDASKNTDSYEINTKNLTTGKIFKIQSKTNEAKVLIDRGSPYEWFVISKASETTETATSDTWKFYNEGQGISNYAPFPAEAISPSRGLTLSSTTTAVRLEWTASDVDEDIASFEVYFDTTENPSTLIKTTTDNILPSVQVASNTIYRWKIVTLDLANNSSTSEIFEFKIN